MKDGISIFGGGAALQNLPPPFMLDATDDLFHSFAGCEENYQ